MRDWTLEEEQHRFRVALDEWVAYKRHMTALGYGANLTGLNSWQVMGLGFCCRSVKGATSVYYLTALGQSFDGWVIVRSLWETALDSAYIATRPTHAERDKLARRYQLFNNEQRLQFARKRGWPVPDEVIELGKVWQRTFGKSHRSWRGKTTESLIAELRKITLLELPDRPAPILEMARVVADWAEVHWQRASKFTHGEPMALSSLWDSQMAPGWTDARDDCDPGWCLRGATYAMMNTILLYAASSPAPAPLPSFPIDD